MNKLKFIPIIGIPEIKSGDNIPKILNKELVSNKINLKDNDILVLTQKIVSKAENRIINLDSIKPNSKAIKLGQE
jgi:coenzyme F420-0:L-glutamate ligase/coenzyme F420-1:gamma-L-glutamate ligase